MSENGPAEDYNTAPVDEDPTNAPTANRFIIEITAVMLVIVVLFVLGAVTESGIVIALALVAVTVGAIAIMWEIFRMTSTDRFDD
ncbi:MAG: hypothetical protein M0P31_10205 [Solirubrobacteraceae bacterium]|nr:hypothetical protein [Solirubrobacteraceae bacterium]